MEYDVLVIGGGHAGCEAAAAAARRGARVALVTHAAATVGAMSCNPAFGGVGKGHLVREIDALDGLMARACDRAAIHYRMLNRSKGPAVQGPRVQADRVRYAGAIGELLAAHLGLTIVEASVESLLVEHGTVAGVTLNDGATVRARTVVLATGTFLGGRLFRGEESMEGGRVGEAAATRLGTQLRELDLPIGRLKTGTPPRLDGRTIDWARLVEQPSDIEPWTMSPLEPRRVLPQVHCAVTRTNRAAHDIIRAAVDRSPLYDGSITGAGPRYCPSIEDKVRRFGDRDGHQLFLEPEGLDAVDVYPNGLSTSLPVDVQLAMLHSIEGLERVAITTPGYAVEYDYLDPRALDHRLALSAIDGLFCAGQINGTTGYEEAGAQGLVAGANAAAHALALDSLTLDRARSYIGVMIDDLVLQGVTEPYRMLTARAEYRLALRADNASTRLTPLGLALGLVGEDRGEWWHARGRLLAVAQAGGEPHDAVREEIENDRAYAPYLARQAAEIARYEKSDAVPLALDFDWGSVAGLSNEMRERLSSARPTTVGQMRRVRGVTPAAVTAVFARAATRG